MKTESILAVLTIAAMFAAGCATTPAVDTKAEAPAMAEIASAVGSDVAAILAAAGEGAKIEFFDADGKAVDALLENTSGSVSIHAADGSGQQNYAFGDDGKVLSHRVSLGEDYSAGKWTEVK